MEISGSAPISAISEPSEPTVDETATEQTQGSTEGPAASGSTTDGGKASTEATTPDQVERFLTLDDVPEEHRPYVEGLLKEREKQMMAAYTKKTQALAQDRQKVDAYNLLEKDPVGTIQRIAQHLGYDIAPKGQQATALQQGMTDTQEWEPQTWDEVLAKAEERATNRIIEQLRPVLEPLYQNLEETKSQGIEHQLSQIDDNWRIYEDDIKQNMQFIKPELLKTPEGIKKLYRMSVPEEVFSSRATQAAMKQWEAKSKAAQVEGKSKIAKTAPSVGRITSFNDAVMAAKRLHNLA